MSEGEREDEKRKKRACRALCVFGCIGVDLHLSRGNIEVGHLPGSTALLLTLPVHSGIRK
jgi:hypothetical protein